MKVLLNSAYDAMFRYAGRLMHSTVAVLSVLVVYLILGASLFTYIETPNEIQECFDNHNRYLTVENITLNMFVEIKSTVGDKLWREKATKILAFFRSQTYKIGYNGEDCGGIMRGTAIGKWNWVSSMLFCITIVTTIGYGHVSIQTKWGKVICMFYSVIGISLMLLCLAKLGDSLMKAFKYLYWELCCCGVCFRRNKVDSQELDHVESRKWEITSEQSSVNEKGKSQERAKVPLVVTITMVILYLMVGAEIFSHYEGWDLLTSAYFCFITLTTIGFGDLIPEITDTKDTHFKIRMIITGVYILFGVALLGMCLSMIQKEVDHTTDMIKYLAKGKAKDSQINK